MKKSHQAPIVLAVLIVGGIAYFAVNYFSKPVNPFKTDPTINKATPREPIPVPTVKFTDVTKDAGITFRHTNGATEKKLLPETMGSGVAIFDYDRDGWQDILFVNSRSWPGNEIAPTLALYRNQQNMKFADVTKDVGLNVSMYGLGVTVGDIDNDGWSDVFITAIGGNHLFRNDKGKFTDISSSAGVVGEGKWPSLTEQEFFKVSDPMPFPTSATFLDYDKDGKLDLFVCHYVTWSPAIDQTIDAKLVGVGRAYVPPTQFEGGQCVLYRNVDGLHFEDVSAKVGVQVFEREGTDEKGRQRNVGKSLGVIVCDPDEDGWPDIVVANDTVRNFFFHNLGGTKFEEIGVNAGVAYAEGRTRGAMGIDWGEFQSGRCAIVIANFANEPDTFLCLDNPKKLVFSDAALSVGLAGPSRGPLKFGTFFFDYDLDGRMDILTANGHLEPEINKVQATQTYEQPAQLFWNTGKTGRIFEPVTSANAGKDLFQPIVGRGSAFGDLDNDGDLDVVLMWNSGPAVVLRNDLEQKPHWVRVRLQGDGKTMNRDAIGAEVTIEAGGVVQRRTVTAARGYLSQSETVLTFGVGKAEKIDKITVRWPSKDVKEPQVYPNMPVDQEIEIKP